jgi:hypothetical protein
MSFHDALRRPHFVHTIDVTWRVMMLSFFDLHYTPFVNLSPFAFNSLYFFISRIKPSQN